MAAHHPVLWTGRSKVKGDRYSTVMSWDLVLVTIKIYRMVKIRNISIDTRFLLMKNTILILLKPLTSFARNQMIPQSVYSIS